MSELVLAIDTTHAAGSLALVRGGKLVEELAMDAPGGFGQVLFTHLGELLARHGVTPGEVDCWASASGPGSFTGVRVGLAAAKGLAEASGRRMVAVSTLRATAWFGTGPVRAPVLDARRGEVFGGLYDAAGAPLAPEMAAPLAAWLASLPDGAVEFLWLDLPPALEGTRFAGAAVTRAPRVLAAAVAHIAREEFLAGRAQDPAAVDANYVRRSDAELKWKE